MCVNSKVCHCNQPPASLGWYGSWLFVVYDRVDYVPPSKKFGIALSKMGAVYSSVHLTGSPMTLMPPIWKTEAFQLKGVRVG